MSLANFYNLACDIFGSNKIPEMINDAFMTRVRNKDINKIPAYQIESRKSYENSRLNLDKILKQYIASHLDFLIIVELVNTNNTYPTYFALLKNVDDFWSISIKDSKINVKKSKRSSLCIALYDTNDNLTMKKLYIL